MPRCRVAIRCATIRSWSVKGEKPEWHRAWEAEQRDVLARADVSVFAPEGLALELVKVEHPPGRSAHAVATSPRAFPARTRHDLEGVSDAAPVFLEAHEPFLRCGVEVRS
jgi:hypothetical protein